MKKAHFLFLLELRAKRLNNMVPKMECGGLNLSTKQQNWGLNNRLKLEKNHRWLVCEVVAVDDSGWPGSWQRNMTSTILHQ